MSVGVKVAPLGLKLVEASLGRILALTNDPVRASRVAGTAVRGVLQRHFADLNLRPNKQGWSKTGFWAQVRASVVQIEDDRGVTVQVNDPRFALRLHGGEVTPKKSRALAIPLKPEFRGVNPRALGDRLFMVRSKSGKAIGYLAERNPDGSLRMAYALKRRTVHKPDPGVMPTPADIEASALRAVTALIDSTLES